MEKTPRQSRIPTFASVGEEAQFWATHGSTDFKDEFEPVRLKIEGPIRHTMSTTLEREDLDRLWKLAKERDMNRVTLARTWVLEGLERAEQVRA